MKKFTIILACFVLFFTILSPHLSQATFAKSIDTLEGKIILEQDNYVFYLSKSKSGNTLLKVKNNLTEEVEYLDIISDNYEDFEMISSNADGSYKERITINNKTNDTILENLNTGETKVLKETTEVVRKKVALSNNDYYLDHIDSQALPGGNGDYVLLFTYKSNKPFNTTVLTTMVGILFAIALSDQAGVTKKSEEIAFAVVSGIALAYYSMKAKESYYIGEVYLKYNSYHYPATWTRYFKYTDANRNYSGYIDATFVKSNHD